eukprot:4156388-Pyramimonas_sp.AAC.1
MHSGRQSTSRRFAPDCRCQSAWRSAGTSSLVPWGAWGHSGADSSWRPRPATTRPETPAVGCRSPPAAQPAGRSPPAAQPADRSPPAAQPASRSPTTTPPASRWSRGAGRAHQVVEVLQAAH